MAQKGIVQEYVKLKSMDMPSWADFKKCAKAIVLSSGIGTFIGALPALGATTAALICYNETKRWSKHKEEFGKGAIEGVAGPRRPTTRRLAVRWCLRWRSGFPAAQRPQSSWPDC